MRKFLLYLLLLAVAASAASCRKAVEKAQRNIRFEGIEKIERQGLTGAEIVVRVMNNTGYKLQLETAEIDVYYADGRVGTVVLREPVEEVLSTLTPREEQVLRMRFGLVDGKPHTLEEVGKQFDVTRERIRQIESKALRKLRHPSRSKKLRDFLN